MKPDDVDQLLDLFIFLLFFSFQNSKKVLKSFNSISLLNVSSKLVVHYLFFSRPPELHAFPHRLPDIVPLQKVCFEKYTLTRFHVSYHNSR